MLTVLTGLASARPGASRSQAESPETAGCPRGGQQQRFAGHGRGCGPGGTVALRTGSRRLDAGARPPWGRGRPSCARPALAGGLAGATPSPGGLGSPGLVLVLPGHRAGLSFSRILLGPHLTHTSPWGDAFLIQECETSWLLSADPRTGQLLRARAAWQSQQPGTGGGRGADWPGHSGLGPCPHLASLHSGRRAGPAWPPRAGGVRDPRG